MFSKVKPESHNPSPKSNKQKQPNEMSNDFFGMDHLNNPRIID